MVRAIPQDPPPRGKGLDGTALSHVLSARGLDVATQRLDELHQRMAKDASPRNVRAYSDAEDAFRDSGGYAAESVPVPAAHCQFIVLLARSASTRLSQNQRAPLSQ